MEDGSIIYQHPRLELKKLLILYLGISGSSNGFLDHFRIQVAVSLLKTPSIDFRGEAAVTWPFRKWNGQNLTAIFLTGVPQRTQVPVRV
jgi:hypothetical protein